MTLLTHVYTALTEVLKLQGPADAVLRRYFKAHERLGRRDRGTIAETVFDVLRQRRLYAYWAQSLPGRLPEQLAKLSLASRLEPSVLQALGLGETLNTLMALVRSDTRELAQAVRLSLPDWLHIELTRSLQAASDESVGCDADPVLLARLEALGQALLEPAPLDLRVNGLRANREQVMAALTEAGIEARVLAPVSTAVRVVGKPAIERLAAFEQGWFEVQDLGSQALVDFCGVRRGHTVVDFCAGAGGKTLAMAAQMHNRGQIFACDTSPTRLARMKPRLSRSGATNVQPFGIEHEQDPRLGRLVGRADRVLVDAPCSGTGTLRRNPEVKWRLTEQDILELSRKQSGILAGAARLVKRGGTLIYATCSLLDAENRRIAETFSREHPGFECTGTMRLWPGLPGESHWGEPRAAEPDAQAQSDGFFATRWVRRDAA
jgi:16S rRNA (cytosine967-C5)-methyltransferase